MPRAHISEDMLDPGNEVVLPGHRRWEMIAVWALIAVRSVVVESHHSD